MEFRGRALPEAGLPAGYAAIIERYDLQVPSPPIMVAVAERHHPRPSDDWRLVTPRHAPAPDLGGQLTFAFRYEGIDLQVLAKLFATVEAGEIEVIIRATLAFGFVYVHPYVDGNGRLHRWLIHHALAQAKYSPAGLVFPVSTAIP